MSAYVNPVYQASREQESRLDEICEDHGTLALSGIRTQYGFSLVVRCEDGTVITIHEDGRETVCAQ